MHSHSPINARLQPCVRVCYPVRDKLQPCSRKAATLCVRGCRPALPYPLGVCPTTRWDMLADAFHELGRANFSFIPRAIASCEQSARLAYPNPNPNPHRVPERGVLPQQPRARPEE